MLQERADLVRILSEGQNTHKPYSAKAASATVPSRNTTAPTGPTRFA